MEARRTRCLSSTWPRKPRRPHPRPPRPEERRAGQGQTKLSEGGEGDYSTAAEDERVRDLLRRSDVLVHVRAHQHRVLRVRRRIPSVAFAPFVGINTYLSVYT